MVVLLFVSGSRTARGWLARGCGCGSVYAWRRVRVAVMLTFVLFVYRAI